MPGSGCGESSICSSAPLAKSWLNRRSADSIAANSAVTQTTPGAIVCNSWGSGPTASGNRLDAMTKKSRLPNVTVRLRQVSAISRRMIPHVNPAMHRSVQGVDDG
jgi:hypothetical protein